MIKVRVLVKLQCHVLHIFNGIAKQTREPLFITSIYCKCLPYILNQIEINCRRKKKVLITVLRWRVLKWKEIDTISYALIACVTLVLKYLMRGTAIIVLIWSSILIYFNRSQPSEWHLAFHSYTTTNEWMKATKWHNVDIETKTMSACHHYPSMPRRQVIVCHEFLICAHSSLQWRFLVLIPHLRSTYDASWSQQCTSLSNGKICIECTWICAHEFYTMMGKV